MEIKVIDLKKSYGSKQALKGINLEIKPGMFGLLGANGAGKTTFMRILATLMPASSGKILIDGKEHKSIKNIKNRIGYIPQEFSFYPQLTVYQALDYLAILDGINSKKKRAMTIEYLLDKVNLRQAKKVKTRALSGGMKQRLGIAQALLNEPELLIVDEPTAGLDPGERVRFRNLLSDLGVDRTVLLSTHIVGDIEFTCEDVAVLSQGQLIYKGKMKDMVQKARGKVWEIMITRDQLMEIKNQYKTISYISEGEEVKVRVLNSTQPNIGQAEIVKPTIEDAYMSLMEGVS